MPAFDVIVCGSLHLDIVVRARMLPRIDETAVGSNWAKICGGKGGNQAVHAARAGARTAMIGRLGNDDFGRALRDHLVAAGVEAGEVATDATQGSGMSVAILQEDGNYGAVIVSGANQAIDHEALPAQWPRLGGARVLVLQNEVPHTVNVAAAAIARAQGATVILNAAPVREVGADLRSLVDVLVVNRVEAEALLGAPVRDRASVRAVLAATARPQSVIVTLGGDGLVVAPKSGEVTEMAAIPVDVTSTHGAGDCFVGTLAARLAMGQSLIEACRMANQQASTFVSRPPGA